MEILNLLHAKREICKAKYDDADECILLSRQNMVNNGAKLLLKSHSKIILCLLQSGNSKKIQYASFGSCAIPATLWQLEQHTKPDCYVIAAMLGKLSYGSYTCPVS